MGIADGRVICDGDTVFEANDIRVGFKSEELIAALPLRVSVANHPSAIMLPSYGIPA